MYDVDDAVGVGILKPAERSAAEFVSSSPAQPQLLQTTRLCVAFATHPSSYHLSQSNTVATRSYSEQSIAYLQPRWHILEAGIA